MEDVYIRKVALPRSVRALTLPNADSSFDIYVNTNLPEDLQHKAVQHELAHIRKDHFYDSAPVYQNEQDAG